MGTVKRTAHFPRSPRSALPRVAGALLARLGRSGHSVALSGPLGAGKSTLARAIGRRLGVRRMPSPTYVLVRRYRTRSKRFPWLIHADLYRLRKGSDPGTLGLLEDLTDPRALVLVEWPERAPKLRTDRVVRCGMVRGEPLLRSFALARGRHHRRRRLVRR